MQAPQEGLFIIDKIEAIIFEDNETAIITKSEVEKLTLEGKPRNLQDTIFERRVYMEAQKFKISADPSAIDRYIAMIMREHNLSHIDLVNMFKSAGYTYDEGREQLGIMFSVNTMLDFKIKSRLIVPEAQIVAFYHEHPQIEEAAYRIQRIFVPTTNTMTEKEVKELIERSLRLGKDISGAQYSSAFWIKKSEISHEKQFITTMNVGKLSKPRMVKGGFELFKLLEKCEESLVPLDKRYQEISEHLKKPLFEKLFEEYRNSLFDSASIVYY
jgi:hypothetical protein